jgi:hypothetical protein
MSAHTAMLMLGMAVLWLVYQFALRQIRCLYCGGVNTHEDHCPFVGSGMTGGKK